MFSYLKCMYNMNKYIQEKKLKSIQFFPIRTSVYQKYIKINTSALIDIFIDENKNNFLNKAGDANVQEKLWNKYFKLKNNKDLQNHMSDVLNSKTPFICEVICKEDQQITPTLMLRKDKITGKNIQPKEKVDVYALEALDPMYGVCTESLQEDKDGKTIGFSSRTPRPVFGGIGPVYILLS